MRVWDLSAGYLNRQSLLAEHRELHGIYSILLNGKKGYSRHPETLRWVHAIDALVCRHHQLSAEMRLRNYNDRTPLPVLKAVPVWPDSFVDDPAEQIVLLRKKYIGKEKGRIVLPRNPQQLWAQHKYSVMARSIEAYQRLGRSVAGLRSNASMPNLAMDLVLILRQRPTAGGLENAIEHMWGHVRRDASPEDISAAKGNAREMLLHTQIIAKRRKEKYLLASTALSELEVHLNSAYTLCVEGD